MKRLILLLLLGATTLSAQQKVPYPTEADALQKLKTKSNIQERLAEIGAKDLSQFTIKLIEKKCFTPSSDEVCYKIYQENNKIEGTSYWVAYEIIGKPDAGGNYQKATALVSYTRLVIGEVTCSAKPAFEFEGANVDAFSLQTKNGLLSVDAAEKMILDTLRKGFDPGAGFRGSIGENMPWPSVCRINKLRTCNFNEKNCSKNYRVKNEMWENTHIIAFETEIYEAQYENMGNKFASMYKLDKMNCIVYCEFIRNGNKLSFKTLSFQADIGNREKIKPWNNNDVPYDSLYVPLDKAGIDKVYGRFEAKLAEPNSLVYFYKSFEPMADDFNKNLGDDENANLKLFEKYFEIKDAKVATKNYLKHKEAKKKVEFQQGSYNKETGEYIIKIVISQKKNKMESECRITNKNVYLENGKWKTTTSAGLGY